MSVTAYACDALQGEVERDSRKTCTGEEWDEERPQACVHMKWYTFADGKAREGSHVVYDAMRKGWRGADKKNGITVDEA